MSNLFEEFACIDLESKPIIKYIKNNNIRKGMLIAAKYKNEICFGWSLCRSIDYFDKYDGYAIAEGRLINNKRMKRNYIDNELEYFNRMVMLMENKEESYNFPQSPFFFFFEFVPITVQKHIDSFMNRAMKYFKGEKFSSVFTYLYDLDEYKKNIGSVNDLNGFLKEVL